MMNKKSWLTLGVIVVFLGGALSLTLWHETRSTTFNDDPGVAVGSTNDGTYTLAEVAQHPDATSCWSVIEGNVYDFTDFIDQHPGGATPILAVCGQDGTAIFNTMPAPVLPAARLGITKYKLGILAQ